MLRSVKRVVERFGLSATTPATVVSAPQDGATPTDAAQDQSACTNMAEEDDKTPPTKFPGQVLIREAEMDGRAVMYVQTVFWVASYVRQRAAKGGVTEEQLIEEFAMNVKQSIDPEWRPDA